MSVPKMDTTERRTVVDVSFPPGCSVNDSIPIDMYLGEYFKLRYPSIDGLIETMTRHGMGCLRYKVKTSNDVIDGCL